MEYRFTSRDRQVLTEALHAHIGNMGGDDIDWEPDEGESWDEEVSYAGPSIESARAVDERLNAAPAPGGVVTIDLNDRDKYVVDSVLRLVRTESPAIEELALKHDQGLTRADRFDAQERADELRLYFRVDEQTGERIRREGAGALRGVLNTSNMADGGPFGNGPIVVELAVNGRDAQLDDEFDAGGERHYDVPAERSRVVGLARLDPNAGPAMDPQSARAASQRIPLSFDQRGEIDAMATEQARAGGYLGRLHALEQTWAARPAQVDAGYEIWEPDVETDDVRVALSHADNPAGLRGAIRVTIYADTDRVELWSMQGAAEGSAIDLATAARTLGRPADEVSAAIDATAAGLRAASATPKPSYLQSSVEGVRRAHARQVELGVRADAVPYGRAPEMSVDVRRTLGAEAAAVTLRVRDELRLDGRDPQRLLELVSDLQAAPWDQGPLRQETQLQLDMSIDAHTDLDSHSPAEVGDACSHAGIEDELREVSGTARWVSLENDRETLQARVHRAEAASSSPSAAAFPQSASASLSGAHTAPPVSAPRPAPMSMNADRGPQLG